MVILQSKHVTLRFVNLDIRVIISHQFSFFLKLVQLVLSFHFILVYFGLTILSKTFKDTTSSALNFYEVVRESSPFFLFLILLNHPHLLKFIEV